MVENALFRLEGDGVPADVQPIAYEAFEGISVPFQVTTEFLTEDPSFAVDKLLRKPLLLTIVNEKRETRRYHGIVDQARFVRVAGQRLIFSVRLRPALAALAHRADCRIFQDMSVTDIVKSLFAEAGFADKVTWQTQGSYPPKEFVCQYRESTLNFVSRLLEDNGIFYYFVHKPDGHTMIVGDDNTAFKLTDAAPATVLTPTAGTPGADSSLADPVKHLRRTRSLRTTNVMLRDYDFTQPKVKPQAVQSAPDAWPSFYYEFPGGFTAAAEGQQRATARMRELRRDADVIRGQTEALGLLCGVPCIVNGAAEDCLNDEFVVTSLLSRGRQNPDESEENFACQNQFSAIPVDAPYAPPRLARRPRIRGLQTAIVTGDADDAQSIFVDGYARIKVHFHWDRLGQFDPTSSCWIRTAQNPSSGSIIHPRVGWEVSVAFLEGDPDKPLVLGRLYNAEATPPYPLPANQASGALKSMSSPGGAGHNEINLADSGGSQGFSIHAQKDLNITINHDKNEKVDVNEEHYVKVNMNSTVGANESLSIGGDQTVNIGASLSCKVASDQTVKIDGNDITNSDCDYVEKIAGDRSYTVGGNQICISNGIEETITGDVTRKVGTAQLVASVASIAENVMGNLTTTVGAVTAMLAKGEIGEEIKGAKTLTSTAAEVHHIKGKYASDCEAAVTSMVGGLHWDKITGNYSVKGKAITLLGAVGDFKVGSSNVKLGGAPVVIAGSTIALKAPMLVKVGASLKMGSG